MNVYIPKICKLLSSMPHLPSWVLVKKANIVFCIGGTEVYLLGSVVLVQDTVHCHRGRLATQKN